MVRGVFRRRPCHLAHAWPGKGLLRRLEISRAAGVVSLRDPKQPARNWRACRPRPKIPLLESLSALGIDPEAWQNYLSLHLAALPGWAGFIKWRADQSEYEWQTRLSHRSDPVPRGASMVRARTGAASLPRNVGDRRQCHRRSAAEMKNAWHSSRSNERNQRMPAHSERMAPGRARARC